MGCIRSTVSHTFPRANRRRATCPIAAILANPSHGEYHNGASSRDRSGRTPSGHRVQLAAVHLLWHLLSYCRERHISLIADCTEWYDASHLKGGPLGPFRWDTELRMRWLQPRIGRVIAISSYLAAYYQKLGCAVIRVPPLVDMGELAPDDPRDRPLDGVLPGLCGQSG